MTTNSKTKYRLFFIFSLILLCSVSCKKEQITDPVPKEPYELWLSQNVHNYSIDQSRFCFCADAGELVSITVSSDTIINVIKISDESKVEYPYYFTIDSLFAIIRNSTNDSLVIRYNEQYGYPEFLDINPQLHPVDGGVLYVSSNLQIK